MKGRGRESTGSGDGGGDKLFVPFSTLSYHDYIK